jgi:Ca2+-binding RTX toxin-like protein
MPRVTRTALAIVVVLSAMLVGGDPAGAGRPGNWSPLTDDTSSSIDMPGMARSADGTLHTVWTQRPGTGGEALMHTSIEPDGTVGPATPIVSGWQRVDGTPDLVIAPDGSMRVFFGGTETLEPGEQNTNLNTATAPADGSTWTVNPVSVAIGSGQFGGPVGATVGLSGTFYQSSGGYLHRGLDQNTPNFDFQAQVPTGDGHGGNLATDTQTGQVWMGWYSDGGPGTGENGGMWAQEVDQGSGAPMGAPLQMPGSVTVYQDESYSNNPLGRTPIVARRGGGIYIAYGSGYPGVNEIRVWRVGSPTSTVVARGTTLNGSVALAPTADGRLWVVWAAATSSLPRIYASISNDAVSAWSPAESVAVPSHPSGFRTLYSLQADAGARLDIIANLSNGTSPTTTQFHTQMLLPPEWTAGDDNLAGTGGADLLYGGPGNDTLAGNNGADDLYGGAGNDTLNGGPGRDRLVGGKGRDLCIVTTGDRTSGCERARRNH